MLELDPAAHTATLVAQYPGGGGFESEFMGDTEPLPNTNVFVGWGSEPDFSEYTSSGKLLLEGEFPSPDLSYRATLDQWVVSWRVLAGSGATRMAVVSTTARSGFETAIPVSPGDRSYRVEALDASGRVIGASRLFSPTAQ